MAETKVNSATVSKLQIWILTPIASIFSLYMVNNLNQINTKLDVLIAQTSANTTNIINLQDQVKILNKRVFSDDEDARLYRAPKKTNNYLIYNTEYIKPEEPGKEILVSI